MVNDIEEQLTSLVKLLKEKQGDNLLGVYLYGSLTMGCFNPESSDIDVLVVSKKSLNSEEKEAFGKFLLEFQKTLSNKLSLTVVAKNNLENFVYPTPYEFEFPDEENIGYKDGGLDESIAAHIVFIKKRGRALHGKPIEELFQDVSSENYLKSIAHSAEWSFNNVMKGQNNGTCRVPNYAVLNYCRILAYLAEGLVASKKEGGEWGIQNLPKTYQTLIQEALKEYAKKNSSELVDAGLLKQFTQYAQDKIEVAVNNLNQ